MNMRLSVHFVLVWTLVVGQQVGLNSVRGNDLTTKAPSSYKWQSGSWGSCHSPTKCGEGQQQRLIWCAHWDNRRSLTVFCDSSSMPEEVRPCFQVCDEHRGKLSWRVSDWGACLPTTQETHRVSGVVQVTFHSTSRYLKGHMSRDVVCVYRKNNHSHARVVSDEACKHFEEKPSSRLPCIVPRSQDCIVTEFGEWLLCSGCDTGNRTRIRRVLVAPKHGGRPCPKLSETEPCNDVQRVGCLQTTKVSEFRLRIGPWTECFSLEHNLEDIQYGFWASVGYQNRDVTCKDDSGMPVDLKNCLGDDTHLTPPKIQACIVPVNCLVSSWSEWSVMKEGCVSQSGHVHPELRKRTREVLRVPLGDGKPCPHLEETHELTDKGKLPSCTKFKWLPGEWSDCMLTEQMKVKEVVCGGGIRRRNLTCLRSEDLVPVEPSLCLEPPPPVVHRCSVHCRQDCVVSSWSGWGPCQPLDCRDAFNGKNVGYQERSRAVVIEPSAGGLDCPPLSQVDTCEHPSCYQWNVTEFSPCAVPSKELKCGLGKQIRKAFCVDLKGAIVDEALCNMNIPMPELNVPCYIPCPIDCVLSPWSEWSPCSRICTERDEFGKRTRNRTIVAIAGSGGAPCPQKHELMETETCNLHSCFGFGWKVLPWKDCKLNNPADLCGLGRQVRDVHCMKDDERHVSDKKCIPLPRPQTVRNCTVPCPKACQLSKFSDWTKCKDICTPDDTHFQERVQHVLQWPEAGQPPCPTALKEVRACPSPCTTDGKCSNQCNTYTWSVQEWGSCVLPDDNAECGPGYRTRGVKCLRNSQKEVEVALCLQTNHTIPEASQPCHVDCDYPCVFSEWSKWTQCPMICGGNQIRSRMLLSHGQQVEECKNDYRFPLNETRGCSCNVHSALAEGDWSDCVLYDLDETTPINGVEVQGRCGVGRRFRRVACYDKNSQLADPYLCTQTGYEEDACMVPCPIDCQMSSWSEWSSCSVACGTGIQYRTRKIISPDFEGGRPCPATDSNKVQREVRLCSVSCHQFRWETEGWTQCELNSNPLPRCGLGHQTRIVRCIKFDGINKMEVNEKFCDPVLKPPSVNYYCHIPCPQHCVVSEWAEWSSCPQTCNHSHVRKRTRTITRKPWGTGISCPLMEEKESCALNENCFNYVWNLTEWTSCTIPDEATCGEGVKQRGVICERSDGRSVAPEYCIKSGVSRPKSEELACMVDCPIDCEVSQWSQWNSDDCNPCGSSLGVIIRRRRVTVNPSSTGRPCPTLMMQRKPCPAQPCYFWHHTSWSECVLEGGQCGYGRKRRDVLCKRTDGSVVDRQYCLAANTSRFLDALTDVKWLEKLLDIEEEEPCFMPCPGDCVMSEWSEWSPCHRDCNNGEQVGFRSRSRFVEILPSHFGQSCPRELFETKPCFGGSCLSYNWKVRSGFVECVRSDGLVVLGGCHGKPRPCVPDCRIPHSECSHSGECMCETGYRSLYRESSGLDGLRELVGCDLINHTNSSRHKGHNMPDDGEVKISYFPSDDDVSFWMYAMIAVGSAFVIFVAVTIYLMCHSTVRRGGSPLRRHSLTVRRNTSNDAVSVIKP